MTKDNRNFKNFIQAKLSSIIACIIIAILGVFFGILPYFAVYKLLLLLQIEQATQNAVIFYVIIAFGGLVLQILCHCISTAISHRTAFSILENIRIAITQKLMKTPLGFTQTKGSGYFKNLLIDEIERLEFPLAHALPETISSMLLPISVMTMMFFVDWRLGLAIFIPIAITLIIYFPMYTGIMKEFENTYYRSIDAMNSRVIEYISGIKEIKIFGRTNDAYSKYEESIDEYQNSTLRLYNKMYYVSSPAFVLLSSILISILFVGGLLYSKGTLSFEIYLFSMIMSLGIGTPIFKFIEFMDNIFHIKNGNRLVKEVLSAEELQPCTQNPKIDNYEIKFNNVSFAYEDKKILNDISLIFRENQKTALVGPSGSGKSTIANLIAKFWEVKEGSITLGGIDYKEIPIEKLMEKINYVTQNSFLFNISIKDNIKIGNPNASDEEVYKAAKLAQCEEFILQLEHGYETIVGDAGAKLSGGQRQRIVIASAILRDAPILILDEATAFADMENQKKLQMSIKALCKNKTLIIIAHRLSTIMDCDQIIVIDKGKARAVGRHASLLKSSQIYQTMWQIHENSANWSVKGKKGDVIC